MGTPFKGGFVPLEEKIKRKVLNNPP